MKNLFLIIIILNIGCSSKNNILEMLNNSKDNKILILHNNSICTLFIDSLDSQNITDSQRKELLEIIGKSTDQDRIIRASYFLLKEKGKNSVDFPFKILQKEGTLLFEEEYKPEIKKELLELLTR